MIKVFNSRRRVLVAGIILLAGGVVFEEWHRAATIMAHHPATELVDTADDAGTEFLMTNKNFEAAVNLWQNPVVRPHAANITYANFVFQSELHMSLADFDRLATRDDAGSRTAPALTMVDKDIAYALFSVGNFKANVTLTPVKADPKDLIPTQVKPGVGGSFDF